MTTPQAPGQSFSSSFVVKPNGEVFGSSIYVDSFGNKIVNGISEFSPPSSGSVTLLSRPDWLVLSHDSVVPSSPSRADSGDKYNADRVVYKAK